VIWQQSNCRPELEGIVFLTVNQVLIWWYHNSHFILSIFLGSAVLDFVISYNNIIKDLKRLRVLKHVLKLHNIQCMKCRNCMSDITLKNIWIGRVNINEVWCAAKCGKLITSNIYFAWQDIIHKVHGVSIQYSDWHKWHCTMMSSKFPHLAGPNVIANALTDWLSWHQILTACYLPGEYVMMPLGFQANVLPGKWSSMLAKAGGIQWLYSHEISRIASAPLIFSLAWINGNNDEWLQHEIWWKLVEAW